MNILNFDIRHMLMILPGILVAFSFHEYAHAQVAVLLGDDTPKYQGRLTLSPLAHIDPLGFITLLLMGFGWAKPVIINPSNFKKPRRDDILVSLAGPAMNFLMAIVFLLLIKLSFKLPYSIKSQEVFDIVIDVLKYASQINIVLMVFNLIPIPPLDGSHVFFSLFNLKNTEVYYHLQTKGTIILIVLIIFDVIEKIISPPINFIFGELVKIIF
ncbi:site-2 protease family protein [Clostridiaceae bacterium M8S5]|nr:site-2 protease family protein [Clostridiaceae bacterium M8S5]